MSHSTLQMYLSRMNSQLFMCLYDENLTKMHLRQTQLPVPHLHRCTQNSYYRDTLLAYCHTADTNPSCLPVSMWLSGNVPFAFLLGCLWDLNDRVLSVTLQLLWSISCPNQGPFSASFLCNVCDSSLQCLQSCLQFLAFE